MKEKLINALKQDIEIGLKHKSEILNSIEFMEKVLIFEEFKDYCDNAYTLVAHISVGIKRTKDTIQQLSLNLPIKDNA